MPYIYTLFYGKIHHIFGRFQGKPPKITSNDKLRKKGLPSIRWNVIEVGARLSSFCNMYQIQFCHMSFSSIASILYHKYQVLPHGTFSKCYHSWITAANISNANGLLTDVSSRSLNHYRQICDLWYCNSSWLTYSTQSSFHDKYQRTKYRNTLTKASAK